MSTGPGSGRSTSSARSGRTSNDSGGTGSEGTPLHWPLRDRPSKPVLAFTVLSQSKSTAREHSFSESLLALRDWIRDAAKAQGTPVDSAEYVCTALDPNARTGLRRIGFDVRRGAPPVHISHAYLRGADALDAIDGIVRGPRGTYAGPHGRVLATYGAAESAVFNLLAFDRDPLAADGPGNASYLLLDKPPHAVIHYDAFDPHIGALVEVTRARAALSGAAVWRKKLGLGSVPEFWLEWRSESAIDLDDLHAGFGGWRAPKAVKACAAQGWRVVATRLE